MYIERQITKIIKSYLQKNKIIILYGARQVGKTTLAKEIFSDKNYLYINGDEIDIQQRFLDITKSNIDSIMTKNNYIIIDEAQKIKNIGTILKIIHDYYPDKKIIATGSSSFDLANIINEPLTGRKIEFSLFPFSISELKNFYNPLELPSKIKQSLITGLYPEIITSQDPEILHELANNYLYKDILSFNKIKKSDYLVKLLQSLALQIGNEVSFNELGEQCGLHPDTVEQYIQLLEQSFIIFRLTPYTTNQRTGIKKLKKIYFRDLGIRNTIIGNLNPIELRNDVGGLWENFVIAELIKNIKNKKAWDNCYFWRDGKSEIDLLIAKNGELHGYEIKYSKERGKNTKYINEKIKLDSYQIINKDNILDFI